MMGPPWSPCFEAHHDDESYLYGAITQYSGEYLIGKHGVIWHRYYDRTHIRRDFGTWVGWHWEWLGEESYFKVWFTHGKTIEMLGVMPSSTSPYHHQGLAAWWLH